MSHNVKATATTNIHNNNYPNHPIFTPHEAMSRVITLLMVLKAQGITDASVSIPDAYGDDWKYIKDTNSRPCILGLQTKHLALATSDIIYPVEKEPNEIQRYKLK